MSEYKYSTYLPKPTFKEWWRWNGFIVWTILAIVAVIAAFILLARWDDGKQTRYYNSLPRHHIHFTVARKEIVEDHYMVYTGKACIPHTRYYYWIISTDGDHFQTGEKGFGWFLKDHGAEVDYIKPKDEAKWICVVYSPTNLMEAPK